jgi:hypothetical protein
LRETVGTLVLAPVEALGAQKVPAVEIERLTKGKQLCCCSIAIYVSIYLYSLICLIMTTGELKTALSALDMVLTAEWNASREAKRAEEERKKAEAAAALAESERKKAEEAKAANDIKFAASLAETKDQLKEVTSQLANLKLSILETKSPSISPQPTVVYYPNYSAPSTPYYGRSSYEADTFGSPYAPSSISTTGRPIHSSSPSSSYRHESPPRAHRTASVRVSSPPAASPARVSLSWNEYQHSVGGQGWSPAKVQAGYHQQKQ